MPRPRSRPVIRTAVAVALAVAALGACGRDTAGADDQRADVLGDGPFDDGKDSSFPDGFDVPSEQALVSELAARDGEVAVLSGTVDEALEPGTFTLDDTRDDGRPVLVLLDDGAEAVPDPDAEVLARGVAHEEFDLDAAELAVGRDLDDLRYRRFEGLPYLEASEVEPDGASTPE